jgi:hypothetical protein
MSTNKKVIFCACALLLGVAVLCAILVHRRSVAEPTFWKEPPPAVTQGGEESVGLALNSVTEPSSIGTERQPGAQVSEPNAESAVAASGKGVSGKKPTVATTTTRRGGKPEPLDPTARTALAFVGADPLAEAYWYLAINDPGLPPVERQDLIEDLNEDGISDPKHPTLEDLPVIVSRLAIIESISPDAMDEVNADAFQEAYKDLVNLAAVALGGGEPVR